MDYGVQEGKKFEVLYAGHDRSDSVWLCFRNPVDQRGVNC